MLSAGNDRDWSLVRLWFICVSYTELMLIINVYCLPAWRVGWCCIVIGSQSYHNSGPITHSIVIMMLVWVNTVTTTTTPPPHTIKLQGRRLQGNQNGEVGKGPCCREQRAVVVSSVRTNCHLYYNICWPLGWFNVVEGVRAQPEPRQDQREGENGGKKCH